MEKLLHERLREWSPESSSSCVRDMVNGRETFIDDCTYDCPACASNAAKKLADEIERYYIPRPRFEDGEPVQFGDTATGDYEIDESSRHDNKEYTGDVIGYVYDRYHGAQLEIERENGDDIIVQGVEGGYEFKRPTPKVYDADGVEIKVGAKGWLNYGNFNAVEVKSLHPKGSAPGYDHDYVEYANGLLGKAKYFTHERPVFDADGVRICKGDTVRYIDSSYKRTVVGFNGEFVVTKLNGLSGDCKEQYLPQCLTHREPDSLEKLRDDMKRNNIDPIPMEINAWVDRLTALIERGA